MNMEYIWPVRNELANESLTVQYARQFVTASIETAQHNPAKRKIPF